MRLVKILGLTIVPAVAAMAFLGPSSAMATFSTSLCYEESTSLECPAGQRVHEFTMSAGTVYFKTSLLTVLCLSSKMKSLVESQNNLDNPLQVKVAELTWENCGSNADHNNCTVTNEKLPLFDILKTGADLGTATALGPEVHIVCSGLNCYYGSAVVEGFVIESALHTGGAGNGMLTVPQILEPHVKGFLCPKTAHLEALYEPTEALWLRS